MKKYNFAEIGECLRKSRKKAKMNQDEFIELLREHGVVIARNRLSNIENGVKEAFSLEFLMAACEIYNCDMGRILGEYPETTMEEHEICEATGLSEYALRVLQHEKENCRIQQLNRLLVNKNFWEIIGYFDTLEKVPERIMEDKNKHNDLYQRYILSTPEEQEDAEVKEAVSKIQFYLEKSIFEYDQNRQKCQILFTKILDKFLPDVTKIKKED